MFVGTVHGLALNDRRQLQDLAVAFENAPYNRAPSSPVLYIKPRNCVTSSPSTLVLDEDLDELTASATLGLVFGVDARGESAEGALACVAAACLAVDLSGPQTSHYRPALRQAARDGFLPLGEAAAFEPDLFEQEIITSINGEVVHRWTAARLQRGAAQAIAEISAFQTLSAGDMLLVGLAGDAPRLRRGDRLEAALAGLPSVFVSVVGGGR